jgi:hypothetical protein
LLTRAEIAARYASVTVVLSSPTCRDAPDAKDDERFVAVPTITRPFAGAEGREVSALPHNPARALSESHRPGSAREEAAETLTAPAIVIAGMHRSGTSLIASAFQLAGVNLGDRLIGRNRSNRRGHFEDIEFEEFHEGVLRRVDKNHLTVTQADVLQMTAEEVERAKALIVRRRERPLWGWKDPRTCLFLDFWHSLLTNPRYVFVYRHPLEIVLSLFRRRMDGEIVEVVTDPLTAIQTWVTYTQAMFDFYRRHQTQCVLGHVHAMAGDLAGTLATCGRKFGIKLESESASTVYQVGELTQRALPKEMLAEFTSLAPLAAMLYRQIDEAADLPEPTFECLDPSHAADEARDGRETLAQEFELLLTRLEPRTVLAGRRALDELREAHGRGLESRVGKLMAQNTELGQRLDEAQHRLVETSRRVAAAEALADERARDRLDLQAQNTVLRDRQVHFEIENARLSWLLEQTERRLTAAHAETAAERTRNSEVTTTLADNEQLLTAISQSRAWRAAQKWYAFKRAVLRLLFIDTRIP